MTEVSTVVEEVVVPIPPVVEVVVPEPEVVYEYQPTDEYNRPLGGKQVFKGKTWQEVVEKQAESNKNLIRLNRSLNTKIRLGQVDVDDIPADLQRIEPTDLEFTPRNLSDEERVQLSRDLLDPDKNIEASSLLFEATIGEKPEKVRRVLSQANSDIAAMRAKEEAQLFRQANPSYYVCPENFATLSSWMVKNDLSPNRQNFEYAFKTLREAGLLFDAPITREETVTPVTSQQEPPTSVNSQPIPTDTSRIASEPVAQGKRSAVGDSSVLHNDSSLVSNTSDGSLPVPRGITVDDIEKMSSEDYRRRLKDPSFRKTVDELYAVKK